MWKLLKRISMELPLMEKPCPKCLGTGKEIGSFNCPECNGTGRYLYIEIPEEMIKDK